MFRQQYKKDFETLSPDGEFINDLTKKIADNSPSNRPKIKKRLVTGVVAAALAICLIGGGSMINQNLNTPSFTLVAYASDNIADKVNIDKNTQLKLPFGKISRNEEHCYVDESGQTLRGYDSGFEHGNISVKGKNIASVTYNCERGDLYYHDAIMREQMEQEGKIKVCEFTVPVAAVTYREGEANSFEKLWEDGYFDNIKTEFFKNKSTDLADYTVQFGQNGEQMQQGLWRIEIYYKFENGYPFIQHGKEITVTDYEKRGERSERSLEVGWSPQYALEMVSEYKPLNFAAIPAEIITVTVHFTNGKTSTQQLHLSFDRQGNLIAECRDKQ